jgi:acetyl esterase/lipase
MILKQRVAGVCMAVIAGLAGGCATHTGRPVDAVQPAAVSVSFTEEKNVIYTPEGWPVTLVGDVYRPAMSGPRPAVLLLHGGGWKAPERRSDMVSIARKLAERGYVVLNATYRTTPDWTYPAPVEDLREAIKWLRAQTKTLGVDPERVGVFGYSAGGHLAALLGLMDGPRETRVQAVVAGGAPSDLTLYTGGSLVPAFMGGTLAEVPEVFAKASPVNHASAGDPPVFIYHGRWDRLVPAEHARRLAAALERAGVRHEIYWLEFRAHITAFVFEGGSEKAAIDFLDREL